MSDPTRIVVSNPISDVIDHTTQLLSRQFSNRVTSIYYGDIGVFPVRAFLDTYDNNKAIFVFDPKSNRLIEGTKTQASEMREIQVNILTMLNMTPYMNQLPLEAAAERQLVQLTFDLAWFLSQSEHQTLGGRVHSLWIGDQDYDWTSRGNLNLRASQTEMFFRFRVKR